MTAGHSDRRLVKIRRRGRHSTPSQVEKVAAQAGKAAPAVAIAGALVAVPSAQHAFAAQDKPTTVTTQAHETAHAAQKSAEPKATLDSISTRAVTVASTTTAKHSAQVKSSHYKVRSGDTLSTIAQHFYDKAADWGYIYHENEKKVSDPNLIYAGETLFIPGTVPADYKLADYLPKHAAPRRGNNDNGRAQLHIEQQLGRRRHRACPVKQRHRDQHRDRDQHWDGPAPGPALEPARAAD